jgi:hypothetical protein
MMSNPQARRVWLVEHPTFRYTEDVKPLARQAGLVVVDPAVAGPDDLTDAVPADQAPALTLRDEFKPVVAAAKTKKEA